MAISGLLTYNVQGWQAYAQPGQAPFTVEPGGGTSNTKLEFPSSAWNNTVVLPLDVEPEENFEKTSEITQSPVEGGAVVSDHVIRKPDKLEITAAISDTPVSFLAFTFPGIRGSSAVKSAYKFLDDLVESRQPCTFVGFMQVYKNYVMTRWNPVHTSKTGTLLKFTATMQRVNIVDSDEVQTQNIAPAKQATASVKKNQGTQNVESTVNPNDANGVSAQQTYLNLYNQTGDLQYYSQYLTAGGTPIPSVSGGGI